MRDMLNQIEIKRCISPVSVSDNTAQTGQIIDRANYESLTYVIACGSIADADATFAVTITESDDSGMSGATAVAAADLIGTTALASFQFDSDNKCFKLGYKGSKRYTQVTITPTNNASAALMSAVAILGFPAAAPTPNPPA